MKESIFKAQRFISQHISILMIKPYPHFMCADDSIYTFCDCWNGLKAQESVRFFFFMAQEHRKIRTIQMLICTWCVFTTSIWQVTERVHVVYGSWFSWRYASLLHFGIGGPRIFPMVAATKISKHFLKLGIIVCFWILYTENMN